MNETKNLEAVSVKLDPRMALVLRNMSKLSGRSKAGTIRQLLLVASREPRILQALGCAETPDQPQSGILVG
jgi:hypothetical protein